jgi:Xaa-Pro aminopeptidase
VSSTANCRYLSGFAADNCLCLLSARGAYYLTDKRYLEAAQKAVAALEVRDIEKLTELLNELPEKRFAVEAEHTTLAALARRQEKYPRLEFAARDGLDKLLTDLRAVKDAREVELIRRAQIIAEQALDQILPNIRPGQTEKEIAQALDFVMLTLGADALSFETIAVSGAHGSLPHGVPSRRKLRSGDLLTLDFGAVIGGYHSDMTRTFAIGKPGDEQRRVCELVLAAQEAGIAAVCAGAQCNAVDAAVRAVFDAAGMGQYFTHSTGHGVGLEIHEAPTLSKNSNGTLLPGMVVTVEPGLYLPGRFGVRIEDMVQVAAPGEGSGCVNLTGYPKEPVVL